jgi:type I restriction enzyme S subunit
MSGSWETLKLGAVCEFDKCPSTGINLPYVGLEHIESNTGVFLGSTTPQTVKSLTFKFSSDHVLYGRLRPYLNKVLLPEFEGHSSTEIFPIRPKRCLYKRFLFHWLMADATVNKIDATSTGARMPRANMNAFLEFDISLPPLPEQKRIVAILDEAFSGISRAKEIAEKNLANAKDVFDSYLENIFANTGEGWDEKSFSDLCDIKHGFAFDGEFFTNEGDYVLLTPGNFYETGGYRDRGVKQKYYVGEIPRDYVLKKGNLLVAMTEQAAGLLGSPLLVPESNKFLHNQRLGLVTHKPGVPWLNEFFFHVFNTRNVRLAIHDSASGVKVRHTSPTKIGQVVMRFPKSVNEQKEVVANLSHVFSETQKLESIYQIKMVALNELKKTILQKAFTGAL